MNLILWFFCWLFIKAFCYLGIIWGWILSVILLFITFILVTFTFLILFMIATNFRYSHRLIYRGFKIFILFRITKRKTIVIQFSFDIEFVKLIIHRIIGFFNNLKYNSIQYLKEKGFSNSSFLTIVTFFFSWVI